MAITLFTVIVALTGGASRADAQSQLLVRLAAVALLTYVILFAPPLREWRARPLVFLASGWIALMVIQLIPLPPEMWHALPGRTGFASAPVLADEPGRWMPLSLAPDLTLNSIAAMLPAFAALLFLSIDPARRNGVFIPLWLSVGAVSAVLGVLQVATGDRGGLYTYAIATGGLPNGLLANRNHSALLLAGCIPLVAWWWSRDGWLSGWARSILAMLLVALFVLVILATGSRIGMVVGAMSFAVAGYVAWQGGETQRRIPRRGLLASAIGGMLAVMLIGFLAFSSGDGVRRATASDAGVELRTENFGTTLDLARKFMPVGSGFGTFDPVFRNVEPDDKLTRTYFNHAHNDLIETAITAGIPGLAVLGALLAWLMTQIVDIARQRHGRTGRLAGLTIAAGLVAGSLTDYPLRTPLMGVLMVFALFWVAGQRADSFTRRGRVVKAPDKFGDQIS